MKNWSQIESVQYRKNTSKTILAIFKSFKQPSDRHLATKPTQQVSYIYQLTLPYFNFFCQPFHTPFYYSVFDQRLFCCYEKLFQPVHKNVIKTQDMIGP